MIDIVKYLGMPYSEGGRSLEGGDCWYLVLAVRKELGLPELPDFGNVTKSTPVAMGREYKKVSSGLVQTTPTIGAIAAVLRGAHLVHVGVVIEGDHGLSVLDTNPGCGVQVRALRSFIDSYYRVIFYRD